jgi:DNA repair protein RadA/Sms
MSKQKIVWSCGECGHQQPKWTGSCSVCQKWNTFVEEIAFKEGTKRFEAMPSSSAQPKPIHEIKGESFQRILTGMIA